MFSLVQAKLAVDVTRGVIAETLVEDLVKSLQVEPLSASLVGQLKKRANPLILESLHQP